MVRPVSILCALLVLAACSSGDDDDGGLRSADEVIAEESREEAMDGEIGEPVDLGDGLAITVSSIEYHDDVDDDGTGNDFRIAVHVLAENTSDEEISVPDANTVCSNTDETSGSYVDSTFGLNGEMPSDTFEEGELFLGVLIGCEDPVVRFAVTGVYLADDPPPSVDFAVPAEAQVP